MDCFLGGFKVSKFFKEILEYFGYILLYIFFDFIMYKGHINLNSYITTAIIILIVFIFIKIIYAIIKKRKNKKTMENHL